MEWSLKNIALLVMVLFWTTIAFSQRYFLWDEVSFWLVGAGMIATNVITYRLRQELFFTGLYFSFIHFSKYVNEWFSGLVGANFNGTFFLLPTLGFTILILFLPSEKKNIGWWKREKYPLKLLWQIPIVVLVGSVAMYWYIASNPDKLSRFIAMLPEGSWWKVSLMGGAFALLNSIVEEYMIRGMVWNGLEKLFSASWILVIVQAMLFGVSHYFGLPGGIIGVLMVFLWSLFMGYVRLTTGGLLGVVFVHFLANLAQFFILYLFI